jgi:hypothetical protein
MVIVIVLRLLKPAQNPLESCRARETSQSSVTEIKMLAALAHNSIELQRNRSLDSREVAQPWDSVALPWQQPFQDVLNHVFKFL